MATLAALAEAGPKPATTVEPNLVLQGQHADAPHSERPVFVGKSDEYGTIEAKLYVGSNDLEAGEVTFDVASDLQTVERSRRARGNPDPVWRNSDGSYGEIRLEANGSFMLVKVRNWSLTIETITVTF